jgi:hypothetical protein
MVYYLYEITNLINGKIYIGVHKTTSIDDGYMGSGKRLAYAKKKYGVEKFQKRILETFQSAEEMYEREKEIVTPEFLARSDTYNLRRGGNGGFDYIHSKGIKSMLGKNHSTESKRKIGLVALGRNSSESTRKKIGDSQRCKAKPKVAVALKSLLKTESHKSEISKSLTGKYQEKVICPYCKLEGGIRAMKRFHFEKCRSLM